MERTSAVEIAAQCWCDPRVSNRVMDVELCKVFAEVLESYANERLEEAAQICDENTKPSKEICNSEYHDIRWCSDCDRMTAMADVLGQDIRALKSKEPGK